MARRPNAIMFLCERCELQAKPWQVRWHRGACSRCHAMGRDKFGQWALAVVYSESETEQSLAGWLSFLTLGIGWLNINNYTNVHWVPGISSSNAYAIVRYRSQVVKNAVRCVRQYQQEVFDKRGALTCKRCEAKFIPSEEKQWTKEGFCSKICGIESGVDGHGNENKPPEFVSKSQTVHAECPAGHRFFPLASFSGCLRPCPICGQLTCVP